IHIEKNVVGLAFLDISTGEFLCAQASPQEADKLLATLDPKELLRMRGTRDFCEKNLTIKCSVFELDDWVYTTDAARQRLLKQFSTASLKGFGVEDLPAAIIAAGSILHYLDLTSHTQISHITTLSRLDNSRYMHLDRFSKRNLELTRPLAPEGKSLLDVIDKTLSPMGGRLLYRWIVLPLLDKEALKERHDAVEAFISLPDLTDNCRRAIHRTGDIERFCSRVASGKISPREMLQLAEGVEAAMTLRSLLLKSGDATLTRLAGS
ncbi:MAG: DNA mismatch repair protein MutS, partial [Muribaculaceae bacterium]|nr:DNA mismatch repair protein MutS [Muribaculaceae bacterium]